MLKNKNNINGIKRKFKEHKASVLILARLFRSKSRAIEIVRSSSLLLSSLLSCKNFNVAHYSKSINDINTKLGILAHYEKMQLQDNIVGIMSLLTKYFTWNDDPHRRADRWYRMRCSCLYCY